MSFLFLALETSLQGLQCLMVSIYERMIMNESIKTLFEDHRMTERFHRNCRTNSGQKYASGKRYGSPLTSALRAENIGVSKTRDLLL